MFSGKGSARILLAKAVSSQGREGSARILLAKAVSSQGWDLLGWFCGSFFVRVGDGELQPIISTEINRKMTVGVSVGVPII